MKVFTKFIICILIISFIHCDVIQINIDFNNIITQLPDTYLSVSIDSSQLVGSKFWSTPREPFNFTRPKLINMAKALAPAIIRVGGTDGDKIYYDLSGNNNTSPPGDYKYIMTKSEYDNLNEFVETVGYKLVFGLNLGPGPRNTNDISTWNSSNAEELLNYSKQMNSILGFELGNEPNLFFLSFGPKYFLQPNELARAFSQLYSLINNINPEWKLVGTDVSFEYPILGQIFPEFWQDTLMYMQEYGTILDIATYHFYPLLSERCLGPLPDPFIATPEKYLHPDTYNKVIHHAKVVKDSVNQYQPQAEIWVGETAGSLCGGEPGVADRYIDSLWWMDQLGLLGFSEQTTGQVRQTLAGSNYGLINETSLVPRPDYFASLGFKQLMGNNVLNCTVYNTTYIRGYAHCSPSSFDSGSITILLINLYQSETIVNIPENIQGLSFKQYYFTPPTPFDITSSIVYLNDIELSVDEYGNPPLLEPITSSLNEFTLPPNSYSFFISQAFSNVCEIKIQ